MISYFKYSTLAILLLVQSFDCWGQKRYRIAFYNVENLFYPENDSLSQDDEYTPNSIKNWTYKRYWAKQRRTSQVLRNIGEFESPDIIGLAEIENRKVLEDLIRQDALHKEKYQIVHRNSPDPRGIDVALIYKKDSFYPIETDFIGIQSSDGKPIKSREILYCKGIINYGDTLHIFVLHFPSKFSGYKSSEQSRIDAAICLSNKIISINKDQKNAKIVVMGDFNDRSEDKSLELLCEKTGLINLQSSRGTIKHRGKWTSIDIILISKPLYLSQRTTVKSNKYTVFDKPYLLEKDIKFLGYKPKRTYIGLKYNDGYSDHLPVYFDLILTRP